MAESGLVGGTIPLTLYLHLPWCLRKCPYCDFNSHALRDSIDETAYIQALLDDLAQDQQLIDSRALNAIFIGGGTPSLFSGAGIQSLLDAIRQRINWQSAIEITLEANPGAIDAEHFAAYRAAGVNRLSIGIQSFDAEHLQRLGRVHNPDQAFRAVETAQSAGFSNINLDLMYGLPQQTQNQALSDLSQAIACQTSHLSWYQLTLEPNTEFHARPPQLPDDDAIADLEDLGRTQLSQAGFQRYEISAYAQPGKACRHNLNYWQFGDYLGLGAGAHSKLSLPNGTIIRLAKQRHPDKYQATAASSKRIQSQRPLLENDLILEFMLNTLRTLCGFSFQLFEQTTKLSIDQIKKPLDQAQQNHWLHCDQTGCYPTEFGLRFLNDLILLFDETNP